MELSSKFKAASSWQVFKRSPVFLIVITFIFTGCLQLSGPDENSELKSKEFKPLPGTMTLEPKKELDVGKYKDMDYDRVVMTNSNGVSYNLSKASASNSSKVFFPKAKNIKITLFKNGKEIHSEILR